MASQPGAGGDRGVGKARWAR